MWTAPQILDVKPDDYHRLPGLSSSIAKIVIAQSPLHAKTAAGRPPSALLDRGAVIHRIVLGKGKDYKVIPGYDDWRKDEAKRKREAARAEGLVPVLTHQFEDYSNAAEKIRAGLQDRGIVLDGASELAIGWNEQTSRGPLACRAMLDHVWLERGIILDLKITDDAALRSIERTAENLGYAIQGAAYPRALAALRPELAGRIDFLFAFCEPDRPHAINLCRGDGIFRELGERRWLRAVETWAECQATDTWPAYGDGVNQLSPPPWALSREGYQ